ncbi:MAG: M20 family metallo-hydrolase [Chthoniobacterales bacterium]
MSAGLPEIDAALLQKRIDELALITEAPPPAVTRVLFSDADLRGRDYVAGLCQNAGLSLRVDAVGNMFARWEGSAPEESAVATGSHIDAIPNAGKFDGVVGVLGGLAAIEALQEAGFRPMRSIELVVFTAEEPTRFGIGCLGSRMLAGALPLDKVRALRDAEGQSLEDLRRRADLTEPLESVALPKDYYAAFVELHIEQGPLLEQENIPVGVVQAIAGPSAYRVKIAGEGGHAGAVLMPGRHDASLAAAELALAVEKAALASGSPDTVATTGKWEIFPNAINSVPCEAVLEIDLRDTCLETRERALELMRSASQEIAARRGVTIDWKEINADPPADGDPKTIAIAEGVALKLDLATKRMVSRAYHDSLFMARICPTTMIFIPCRNGYSHRPEEYSDPAHIAAGTRVLAGTLARLSHEPLVGTAGPAVTTEVRSKKNLS